MSAPVSDRRPCFTSSGVLAVWVALASCDASARPEVAAEVPDAAPPQSAQAVPANLDAWVGTYHHTGGQAERDAVLAAIEDVVGEMNIIARGIARDRLQESNPVPKAVTVRGEDESLIIAFDDREYAAPIDGTGVKVVGVTGETLDYRVEVSEDRIRQHFIGSKGSRANTIQRRGDKGLRIQVKVSSGSLPKPLEYTLTLERAS